MAEPYFESVVRLLRTSGVLARHGLLPEDVQWYRKGANRHDLMVITKAAWTVPSSAGNVDGYTGVNVHLESDRPGCLQVHCELWPRQGSEACADPTKIAPLLAVKGELTLRLRRAIEAFSLGRFGVNLKRISKDPSAPSSLKVMGFETDLPAGHDARDYVARIEPIIDAVAAMINSVIVKVPATTSASCASCSQENPLDARYCRRCGASMPGGSGRPVAGRPAKGRGSAIALGVILTAGVLLWLLLRR